MTINNDTITILNERVSKLENDPNWDDINRMNNIEGNFALNISVLCENRSDLFCQNITSTQNHERSQRFVDTPIIHNLSDPSIDDNVSLCNC
jgi:hypothetical protein